MGILSTLRNRGTPWISSAWNKLTGANREIQSPRMRVSSRPTYAKLLPWIDSDIQDTPELRRTYRKMFRDPIVKSALLTKILSVASLDFSALPADEERHVDRECSEFCQWTVQNQPEGASGLAINILIHGLIDGYFCGEKQWATVTKGEFAGKWTINDVRPIHPDLYDLEVDQHGKVIQVIGQGLANGERYPPEMFVLWRHLPLYASPLGQSDLAAAYQAYWRRDTAWKLRHHHLKNHSGPYLIGKWQDKADQNILPQILEEAKSGGFASIPSTVALEVLAMAGQGTRDFEASIDALNHEITLSIQGAFLQSLEGNKTGARATGEVHEGTSELRVWQLAESLGSCIQRQMFMDLCDLNYVGFSNYPKAKFGGVNDTDLKSEAELDQILVGMGLPLGKASAYDRFRRTPPTDATDKLSPPTSGLSAMGMLGGQPGVGQQGNDTAGATGGSELLGTVGGATSVINLQSAFGEGKLTREQAINTAVIVFGMSQQQAEQLFPIEAEEKLQQVAANEAAAKAVQPPKQFSDRDVAGGLKDARKAEQLLADAIHDGTAVMSDIARSAVRRLLKSKGKAKSGKLFSDDERQELADSIAATISTAHLLGQSRIRERLNMAKSGRRKFTEEATEFRKFAGLDRIKPLPPVKALNYFKGLYPDLAAEPAVFAKTMERLSFTMAEATETTMLTRVQDIIAKSLETGEGGTPEIQAVLDEMGVTTKNPAYSDMVHRTNCMSAYNQGAEAELKDPEVQEAFPVWRYDGIDDDRAGEDHKPKFGKYYPADSQFSDVRGERIYNCRCVPTPIYVEDWRELQEEGERVESSW